MSEQVLEIVNRMAPVVYECRLHESCVDHQTRKPLCKYWTHAGCVIASLFDGRAPGYFEPQDCEILARRLLHE